ncbi:MAG TPA: GspB domain-containing protein [Desulfuromonadales bacterium]|nr:GspB domain-containing protein [Desulfuromonadales bacterium]
MSSILKALKKLEEEKAVRRPGVVSLDAVIMHPDATKPRSSPVIMVVVAMLIFGGGSVATYFIMMRLMPPQQIVYGTKPGKEKPLPAPVPAAIRSGALSTPSTLPTEILPEEVVVVPSQPSTTRQNVKTLPMQRPAVSQPAPPRVVQQAAPLKPATGQPPPSQLQHQPVAPLPSAISVGKAAAPRLRVNGIAFQKGSSDNMAIINGTPASNGSTVEGATVEEILKDRVRFSFHGETIEIPLGQSNR